MALAIPLTVSERNRNHCGPSSAITTTLRPARSGSPCGICTIRGDEAGSVGSSRVTLTGSTRISSSTVVANAARGGESAKSATALASTSRVITSGVLPVEAPPSAQQADRLIWSSVAVRYRTTAHDSPAAVTAPRRSSTSVSCHRWPASMCHIALRSCRYAVPRAWVSGADSADVAGRSGSVVRFCGGVRCCGGCSFGGGDVSVHRCRGFDPSVGDRRRWRCGRRWPPMTRCCARRSRRTGAGCSSTPVTGCAPRSPRRGRRWMRRWPHSGRWSCRCGWGMATGEAELREGDYFGAVLNRAARVMAAGHGGQVLLDDTTAGLLQRHRPDCLGAAAITGHRQTRRDVPGPGRRPA